MEIHGQPHASANLPLRKGAPSTQCIQGWMVSRVCLNTAEKR